MKSKKIKSLLPIVALIVCITLVFYYFVSSLLDNFYLKKDFAYTISNNVTIGTPSKAGNESKYTFFLNGKWYAGFTNLPLRRDGTKYFIKFYPQNPNRNEATKIIANSEDISKLPRNGYKKLPHQ